MGNKSIHGGEPLPRWAVNDYIKNITKLLLKLPIWGIQFLLFALPVQKDLAVIYSLRQRGYSCNLKYLDLYLRKYCTEKLRLVWVVNRKSDMDLLRARGVDAFMLYSKEHFAYRFFAKYIITNDDFYSLFIKRRGQRYINTWHGGINYKRIGYEGILFSNPVQKLIFKLANPEPDIFVSGSLTFSESTAKAFGFKQSTFLSCGLPRNDVFFAEHARLAEEIKRSFGIKADKRIVLYAPTFRKDHCVPKGLNSDMLRDALRERFGGEWLLLIRRHYFDEDTKELGNNPDTLDVSHYEDMQELLLITDVLISDYSSSMWDFSMTERPVFTYMPDVKGYTQNDRGFFINPENMPYPVSRTPEELYKNIRCFDEQKFRTAIKKHHDEAVSYECGHSAKRLAKAIISLDKGDKNETSYNLRNI